MKNCQYLHVRSCSCIHLEEKEQEDEEEEEEEYTTAEFMEAGGLFVCCVASPCHIPCWSHVISSRVVTGGHFFFVYRKPCAAVQRVKQVRSLWKAYSCAGVASSVVWSVIFNAIVFKWNHYFFNVS